MAVDIALIIVGIVILIASVIFAGNSKEDDDSFFTKEKLSEKQNMVDEMVKKSVERLSEEAIVETDDALSKLSNEKIMAINEFSESNLAKIQENHDHVVFLYNMLNAKDDEIKQTLSDMENAKQSMKDTVNDVVRITRQLNSAVKKNAKAQESEQGQSKAAAAPKKQPSQAVSKESALNEKGKADYRRSSSAMADEATGQMNLPEMMQSDNKNEEILKLHKAGKLSDFCAAREIDFHVPPLSLCGDNGVMIAAAAKYELEAGAGSDMSLDGKPSSKDDWKRV